MVTRKLLHYEVGERIGAGAMGQVYLAHDTRLGRDVAIKLLSPDGPWGATARRRFKREAMAASALNHPNIITIHEINSEGDTDFIVMEYVRGTTLAALLKTRKLDQEEALRYGTQIADALVKAHAAGVVHRDLKPGNIMVTSDGIVKVLDFGLAKFSDIGEGSEEDSERTKLVSLTLPGVVTGTASYMSPEQARGDEVDARSDIFSFGIVLYQMLSGQLPFPGGNVRAVFHNIHFTPPPDLKELVPGIPAGLAALVSQMLEKETERRIPNMLEVSRRLRQFSLGGEGSGPSQPTAIQSDTNTPPRPVRGVWIVSMIALLGLATVVGWYVLKPAAHPDGNGQSRVPQGVTQEIPVEDNAEALTKRARQEMDHYDLGDNLERAIKHLERAIALDPQSAPSYAILAEAYFQKNLVNPDPHWTNLTSEYAHKAASLDGYLASGHVAMGLVSLNSGDSVGAEKEFRAAIELDPKNPVPHRRLGRLYVRNGKEAQGVAEIQRALELGPNDWRNYTELGVNDYNKGRYPQAVTDLEKALQLEPDSVLLLQNLGGAFHGMGRDDDAVATLQRALEIKPNADIFTNLGTIVFYQGHYEQAVDAFEKAVKLGANQFDNWANLGDAYRWTPGNRERSKQPYQEAIRLVGQAIAKDPKSMELHTDLAMYLAKSGDTERALKEIAPVANSDPQDPAVLYNTAIVYEICGKRDNALSALERFVRRGGNLNDIRTEPEFVSLRSDPRYHLKILSLPLAQTKQ